MYIHPTMLHMITPMIKSIMKMRKAVLRWQLLFTSLSLALISGVIALFFIDYLVFFEFESYYIIRMDPYHFW